ncbi:MAG: hypothetical protein IIT46_04805 [Lachnospiraceae bacterium]|jgi:hypothetical protein|nr:hypothetical protein [Lachnospiraceae bacterium]
MKKTMTKKIAAILAVMTMVTAGSAFAITANAASADTTTTSNFLAERRVHKFDLTDHEMTFKYMTDIDENVVNPYLLFGSSFRVGANSMFMTNDGKFSISLGVDKGEGFGGTYVYHGASEKIFLSYNDGFKATGYVTILNDGTRALGIPMNICGNIYTVYFAI